MEVLTLATDHPGGLLGGDLQTENKCHLIEPLEIRGMKMLDHTEILLVSTMIGTGVITGCLIGRLHQGPILITSQPMIHREVQQQVLP